MTLFNKIALLVITLFGTMLLSSFSTMIISKRHYLQDDLFYEAQDTATSVALTLSGSHQTINFTFLQTMIDAIFNRGHYLSIAISDRSGHTLYSRESPLKIDGVPRWFVQVVQFETLPGQAEVIDQWKPVALLKIDSHPGQAYLKLWEYSQKAFVWFLGIGSLIVMVVVLMVRHALKPLEQVASQAVSICQNDLTNRIDPPKASELRYIVRAMNIMSERLEETFNEQVALIEQVREQAHVDPVTGMGNQIYFYSRFFASSETSEEPLLGALLILKLKDFSLYNGRYGHVAGDLLLKQVAGRWLKVLEEVQDSVMAKRSGADFIAWLPKLTSDEAEYYLHAVYGSVRSLPLFVQEEKQDFIHIGLAHCDGGIHCEMLLDSAEEALRIAQSKGVNGVHVIRAQQGVGNRELLRINAISHNEWRQILVDNAVGKRLRFFTQTVLSMDDQTPLNHEVLLRLDIDGEVSPANLFIPLIERYGLQQEFDKSIILHMIHYIRDELVSAHFSSDPSSIVFTINLSPHTLQIEGFIDWLLNTLKAYPGIAQQIVFELPEHSLSFLVAKIQTLATGLKKLGGRVALDRFGTGWKGFSYLGTLPLYAIKIDYSYIRSLNENHDYQFFVKSLLRIAHSRDILVLAGNVETVTQWDLLRSYGVDGGQGYFLSRPEELPSQAASESVDEAPSVELVS